MLEESRRVYEARARGPREVEVGLPSQASEGAPPFSPASPHRWVTLRIAALTF